MHGCGVIRPEHLPPTLREAPSRTLPAHSLDDLLAEKEREAIVAALQQTDGIQTKAAKLLGISERSLWYRVKKLRIDPAVVHRPP